MPNKRSIQQTESATRQTFQYMVRKDYLSNYCATQNLVGEQKECSAGISVESTLTPSPFSFIFVKYLALDYCYQYGMIEGLPSDGKGVGGRVVDNFVREPRTLIYLSFLNRFPLFGLVYGRKLPSPVPEIPGLGL